MLYCYSLVKIKHYLLNEFKCCLLADFLIYHLGRSSSAAEDVETHTNPIDRIMAHLLFYSPSVSSTEMVNEKCLYQQFRKILVSTTTSKESFFTSLIFQRLTTS